tara:strand:- start:7 stop:642 length:636 start_codon:yes stop_codon:yes gene_type:complete
MTEVYSSPYANNIPRMSNSEVVCLAKNRFTDSETMVAIAKHWYRLGKQYLAANPSLTEESARILWDHRGYVLKSTMIEAGNIELTDQEYIDTYRQYFKGRARSSYRMMNAFLGRAYYWQSNQSKTPATLLEEIYEDFQTDEHLQNAWADNTYMFKRFITHQNCPLSVALKIGTMKTPEQSMRYYGQQFERLREEAMLKVAEITKRESAVSR